MGHADHNENDSVIKFTRERDYILIKELGSGACGRTVLLKDEYLNELFVCKKFAPYLDLQRDSLYNKFVEETRILHKLYHPNIVRIYNYYLYPDAMAGYILMEYIDGDDIGSYIRANPALLNDVFQQTITGFHHLEQNKILHRDIRPLNILLQNNGTVKIIDFGFGKFVQQSDDFKKSVSLNWWCDTPEEFNDGQYNYSTEVYFVGKLFEKMIQENEISNFEFMDTLSKMCQHNQNVRYKNFNEIVKDIQGPKLYEIGFDDKERYVYRCFSDELAKHITKLERQVEYLTDVENFQTIIENEYRKFMLEQTVPDCNVLFNGLISGPYYYIKAGFPVFVVRDFIKLLKASSTEKKQIIFYNLQSRIDAIERYVEIDEDLPF